MLSSSIKNAKEFLELFYSPEFDNHKLTEKTKISLFVLRIDGGNFDLETLNKELGNASLSYALSRVKLEATDLANRGHEIFKKVRESFRDYNLNDGEGGELLLYCFLETHLKAPKILTKMELKLSGNDYVKGIDGIHLLKFDDGVFHLIFGESKMIGDSTAKGSSLQKAISAAFDSVKKIKERGFLKEINLIDSNLMKESFDTKTLEYLKRIILPSARDEEITKSNAFGIFMGFEVDISDMDLQMMKDSDFEKQIKETIKNKVEERFDFIKEEIIKHGLDGYHFYIYALPFFKNKNNGIDSARKSIIEYIQK